MDKDEKKNVEKKEKDEFSDLIDGFNEDPLNLTNQDKDKQEEDDPQTAAKIKQQYEKFMKEMQGGFSNIGGSEEEPSLEGLGKALGGLLSGLSEQLGGQGEGEEGKKDIGKMFQDMFSNINEDNMEEAASNLLNEFMDKSLLLEPLKQTKVNYQQYFKKEEGKIPESDLLRYQGQYDIVLKILNVLQKNPENKSEMIALFEKMQEYGQPPEGIAPASGLL